MADLSFKVVDNKKWESLPPSTSTKKDDKYTPVLDALEAGEILEIPTSDNKELKGIRITLGRKAAMRGFKVESRNEGNLLYVRKSTEPLEPKAPKERKQKEAASA
jgi:hypothetical protein